MPTRVQNRPAEMSRVPSEKFNEHDPTGTIHPKETLSLRLALGSILAPKRPYTPSSRSSSGTASPAHPSSFAAPSLLQPPPPAPNSTPNTTSDSGRSDGYLHPRHVYQPRTPSHLGLSDSSHLHRPSGSPTSSPPPSAPFTPGTSQGSSPSQESPPPLDLPPPVVSDSQQTKHVRPLLHVPKPASAPQLGGVSTATSGLGTGTPPRAKFIETLDSKSAWDALIHGSFS